MPQDKATVNNFYKQKLRIKDNTPTYIKNYRTPFTHREEIDKQVDNLLTNKLIEPSRSCYNSPIILVPKKSTGTPKWRMCIDYRQVNKRLIADKYPLPRIEDILDNLGRARYFSVLDLFSGFHQIPLERESRDITSFSTHKASYRWKVLPFGLNVSPNSFSRMMALAFTGATHLQHFLYMDDIIITGCSKAHHLKNITSIFDICRKFNLKLNPEKCKFFKSEVTYLGHRCTDKGIFPDSSKLDAVSKYPVPTSKEETKKFIAFANYYRKFIPQFAQISKNLNQLTKKTSVFCWTADHQKSFDEIKSKLIKPPVLVYPDFNKEFVLLVDASKDAVGSALCQQHHDKFLPISYASRTFTKGEQNKSTIEKELLAIYFAIIHYRPYLYGSHFTVKSDHKPLTYLFALKDPSSRLTRIRLDLEEYNFTVEYIAGKSNVVADALSRITISDLKSIHSNIQQILTVKTRSMSRKQAIQNNESKDTNTSEEILINDVRAFEAINTGITRKWPTVNLYHARIKIHILK